MSDILSTMDELRQTGAQFLITDVETALTFVDIAEQTDSAETRARNIHNASRAYATVKDLASRANLLPNEAEAIASRMAELKRRLGELGEQV